MHARRPRNVFVWAAAVLAGCTSCFSFLVSTDGLSVEPTEAGVRELDAHVLDGPMGSSLDAYHPSAVPDPLLPDAAADADGATDSTVTPTKEAGAACTTSAECLIRCCCATDTTGAGFCEAHTGCTETAPFYCR